MICTDNSVVRQQLAGEATKPPLHPVADDRIADLLGDGEADAKRRILIATIANLEDETGHRESPAAVGSKEIGTLAKND